MSGGRIAPERLRLIAHVQEVQREIRSCAGCGECCTAAYNSIRILPLEAQRIAAHVRVLPEVRRRALLRRIDVAIGKYGLSPVGSMKRYTCSFLERDRSCALPFDVKPLACLAFNPIHAERCEMEVERFHAAHDPVEEGNRKAGLYPQRLPIPLAVRNELLDAAPREDGRRRRLSNPTAPIFLPRHLSKLRVVSRKEAEDLVKSGVVEVNGVVRRDVLFKVRPGVDKVRVRGVAVDMAPDPGEIVWIALNKPEGVVTTTYDPEERRTVMDLVPEGIPGLAPVGRLDRASGGLILLTNDHGRAHKLLAPAHRVEKRYRVKVKGRLDDSDLSPLRRGMTVGEVTYAPATVEIEKQGPASTWLRIGLTEGKNREIRRMMEALGREVEILLRVSFGPIALSDLAPGAWRWLDAREIAALEDAATGYAGVTGPVHPAAGRSFGV